MSKLYSRDFGELVQEFENAIDNQDSAWIVGSLREIKRFMEQPSQDEVWGYFNRLASCSNQLSQVSLNPWENEICELDSWIFGRSVL